MPGWDRKRQLIWIAGGLIVGTYVAYSDSLLEDGTFVPRFFIFMEATGSADYGGTFLFVLAQ